MKTYKILASAFFSLLLSGCNGDAKPPWMPGEKLVLINSKIGNGSFEDWSGANVKARYGNNDDWRAKYISIEITDPAHNKGSTKIPGWIIQGNQPEVGFAKGPTSHMHSFAYGILTAHYLLLSDPCGKSVGFVEGTVIRVSFDAISNFTKDFIATLEEREVPMSRVISVGAGLYFDGDSDFIGNHYGKPDLPGIRHWLGGVRPTEDYMPGDVIKKKFEITLNAEEAEAANKNGIRLGISVSGYNPQRNCLDNVVMTATKPVK